jgi:hypothetical protein
MKVDTSHHIDASEPDADGQYDYRYEYDIYTFSDGEIRFIARSYTDENSEAHFLRVEINDNARLITVVDLKSPLFSNAVIYLRQAGKTKINWLSGRGNGYEPVDAE